MDHPKPTQPSPKVEKSQSWREQVSALRHLPPFFKLVWQANPIMTAGNIGLRLMEAAIPLATLYIGKEIIDEVVALIGKEGPSLSRLWWLVGIELALALVSDLFNRGISLLDSLLGDLVANKTSVDLIRHAATLDLFQFEDAKFYDKLERARRQTTGRTVLMSQVFEQGQALITILFLGAGLVAFNPWLILLLVVAVIPSFLGETYFNQRSYSLTRSWTPERRELDYLRYIGASDETAKEVKIFNLSEFITERFKVISDRYFQANKNLALRRAGWGSLFSTFGSLAYYGAYVLILLRAVQSIISLGELTFLAGAFNRMRGLLQGFLSRFSRIAEGALYLQDLFDFFEIKPDIINTAGARPFPKEVKTGFIFENVSFKYPGSDRLVIQHLSFTLHPKEKLALVGENGAGKTTLVKLLARLYDPTEGRILLDGIDLREFDLTDLRRNVGVIFQDFVRFQLNVAENVAVGSIQQKEEMELIESAAQKSLANEVIENLPEGYKQMLGRRFQNGVELSGGQWQKIALARAYMKDAQLLILDEPTAALDARAEHEVFLRFSELIAGRMAVLISHRFSTVRMADRILVLENGTLAEIGSHTELLTLNGKYAELFTLQAKGYL